MHCLGKQPYTCEAESWIPTRAVVSLHASRAIHHAPERPADKQRTCQR